MLNGSFKKIGNQKKMEKNLDTLEFEWDSIVSSLATIESKITKTKKLAEDNEFIPQGARNKLDADLDALTVKVVAAKLAMES